MRLKTLLDDTITRLHSCPVGMVELARRSELSRRWLYNLKNREIPDPGVLKIIALNGILDKVEREDKAKRVSTGRG